MGIKKCILVSLSCVGMGLSLHGQSILPDFIDTNERVGHQLIVQGRVDLSASSISNAFTNRILFGGFISDELKADIYKKSKEINRVGLDFQQEIRWENNQQSFGKQKQFGWFLQGGNYVIGGAAYNNDLLRLALDGNKNYLGDTSFFEGSSFEYQAFQKLGFGVTHRKSDIQLAVNLVSVSSFARSFVREGWMAFDSEADTVSLLLNGNFYSNKPKLFSGVGMALDYSMRIPFQIGKKKSYFRLDLKNIGFAQVSQVTRYLVDSSYSFQGFTLNQISPESGVFRDDFSFLDSLGISEQTVRKWVMLPGFAQIGKAIDVHDSSRLQAFYGIRLYTTLNAVPMIYAGAFYRFSPKWWTSASLVYGGFSNFRGGIQAGYQVEKARISVGTEDVFGLISQKGLTRSIQLRLQWIW